MTTGNTTSIDMIARTVSEAEYFDFICANENAVNFDTGSSQLTAVGLDDGSKIIAVNTVNGNFFIIKLK